MLNPLKTPSQMNKRKEKHNRKLEINATLKDIDFEIGYLSQTILEYTDPDRVSIDDLAELSRIRTLLRGINRREH